MGADAYTRIYVGARVVDSAFWTEHTDAQGTCPKGHAQKAGQGEFCDKDGGKFETRTIRKPTKGFKRVVVELLEWEPGGEIWDEGWDNNYRGMYEEHHLFNADSVTSSEARDETMAIGVRILSIGGGGRQGPRSIGAEELGNAFSTLQELQDTLGVKGKHELFGQLYWSV